ncbi:KAP family NTPase [Paracoccaceae bacterium]|nr:KAP family NTPase [Paracoccaceae bacterium]
MVLATFQDMPITSSDEDTMGIGRYTKSLSKFIGSCEAPMTVGLQGNWGTGKTSLMKLLQSELSSEGIYSIWVNTWEHSVFLQAEDTTPQILLAMAEQLKFLRNKEDETKVEKGKQAADDLFFVGKNALNQFMSNKLGIDLKKAQEEEHHTITTSPVARIRDTMAKLVLRVVESEKNKTQKVVFFIDDLDRIKPTEAVDVIEALKNVFDGIPNCVFVLAIDYEVIKKGLRSRYGSQQEAEREFKSFFDKMIQVPFSMPTSAMNIKRFVDDKLLKLGISKRDKYFEKYVDVLSSSIGTNPRSLKRFFNTYSLQKDMVDADRNESEVSYLTAIINAMEIAFPQTWALFLENQNLIEWGADEFSKIAADLKLDDEIEKISDEVSFKNPPVDIFEIPALLVQLNEFLAENDLTIKKSLNAVLDTVKITSTADHQVEKRDTTKAREAVDLETHFQKTNLRNGTFRQSFEELIGILNNKADISCKVATNQCSIKKEGYNNSLYVVARPTQISFSTTAKPNQPKVQQIYAEIVRKNVAWKVKQYRPGLYHLVGAFQYYTPVGELAEQVQQIVRLHSEHLLD